MGPLDGKLRIRIMNGSTFVLVVTGVLLNAAAQLALKASVRDTGAIEISAAAALPTVVKLAISQLIPIFTMGCQPGLPVVVRWLFNNSP